MTKTLTEQWREGKLPEGCYYILDKNGHVKTERTCFYSHTDEQCFSFTSNKDIEEVIASVPTYAEFKDLMSNLIYIDKYRELLIKTDKLEKKLEIATKALKEYANCKPTEWMSCVTADKALREMEGVK